MADLQNPHVLIVAGEASSAAYAVKLLKIFNKEKLEVKAFGIGSREMESLGFECLGRSEEMAVVGIQEVIKVWPTIKGAFESLVHEAEVRRPKFALLMDYPDFNLRLAKKLKSLGIKVIYYISPQVWAWRKGRVKTIRKYVDKMLVLFPFEEKFYREHGVDVEFVGHPILDDISNELFDRSYIDEIRSRYGISKKQLVLGLMPGSRTGEIHHHLHVQIEVARRLYEKYPQLSVVVLVAPTKTVEYLQSQLGNVGFPITVIKRDPFEMIALTDVVLVASGTATLMVGLMQKPMVIMYLVNWLTRIIGETLVRNIKFFGLPNIVCDRLVAVELKTKDATVERLTHEMDQLISNEGLRNSRIKDLSEIQHKLGDRGASIRVANILKKYL